jgi:AbrB family looped-hinge helix DNA binding protein
MLPSTLEEARNVISKIYKKGQLTIPVRYRRRLGLGPGDEVEIVLEDDHLLVIPRKPQASPDGGMGRLAGAFRSDRPHPDKARRRDLVQQTFVQHFFRTGRQQP